MPEVVNTSPWNAAVFLIPPAIAALFGYPLGVFVLSLHPAVAGGGLIGFTIFIEVVLGRSFFTSVALGDGYVRLRSPFRKVTIRSEDMHHQSLWRKRSDVELLPYWQQAAVLTIWLVGGSCIHVSMFEARVLREIATCLGPYAERWPPQLPE